MSRGVRLKGLCALLCMAVGACSSSPSSAPGARPLAVKADGTLDPDKIDLSGVAGVTPAEQHRAEALLRSTIVGIQRWSDVLQAKRDGFTSIGDRFTGSEHFVHWDWLNDGKVLDASRPESLVYNVQPDGRRILEAAMFILPSSYNLSNTPDLGGPLTQFHIHTVLCFDRSPVPMFHRPARPDGSCPPPFVKRLTTPMVHVWIRPNPCGPFAAIGGFANGTVKHGERTACDREHGSPADI
jgi:hypothetical protein